MDRVAVRLSYEGADAEAGLKRLGDTADAQVGRVRVALGTMPQAANVATAATGTLGQAADKLTTSLARQEQVLTSVTRRIDPLRAAVREAQRDYDNLSTVIASGSAKAAEAAALLPAAQARLSASQKALTVTANENTKAFALNRVGLLELQAAGVNSFQALAAGMSPLRVATMEGAQVIGAFAQGGLGLSRILGALVSPIGLTAIGIGTLAAGFAVLSLRASDNEAALRKFGVALGSASSPQIVAGLQAAARELRDMGVASEAANQALAALARNPIINPSAASQLVKIGGDVGARLGVTPDEGLKALEQAISGGAEAIVKFGISLRAMDADEAANILTMDRHGQHIAAVNRAIGDIAKAADDARKQSLTPGAQAIESIGNAWSQMLDKLSATGPIRGARDAIVGMLKGIAAVASDSSLADTGTVGEGAPFGLGRSPGAPPIPNVSGLDQANAARIGAGLRPLASPSPPVSGYASNFSIGSNVQVYGEVPAFADMLSHAAEQLPPGYSIVVTSGGRPGGSTSSVGMGSAHVSGSAADFQIVGPNGALPNTGRDTSGLYGSTFNAALGYAQWAYPDLAAKLRTGATFGANGGAIGPGSPADIGHIDLRGAGGSFVQQDVDALGKAKDANNALAESVQRELAVERLRGSDAEALRAKQDAYTSALGRHATVEEATKAGEIAAQAVRDKTAIQLGKAAEDQRTQADLATRTAEAYGKDEVAGLRAAADAQARLAQLQEPSINLEQKRAEILRASATAALESAAQQNAAIIPQIAAEQRLADASARGTAALHEQQVVNTAIASTQDAVNKALATGDAALLASAKAAETDAIARQKRLDVLKQETQLNQSAAANDNAVEVLRLEASLQGQTADYINTQVSLLRTKQDIQARGVDLTSAAAQNELRSVTALGQANAQLAEASRQQQRIDDAFRSIGQTIDSSLTKSIEDAFNGQKVTDWGDQIKHVLASVVSQIASATFIKPLIGSVLQMFGANSAAQQFGSLSSLFGGGSGSSGSVSLTPNGSGGFTLSNVSSASSLANDGGLFGDTFGGVKSFFNDLGGSLGFAQSGLAAGTGSGAGIFTNLATGATSDVLGSGVAQGFFGGTTFGGALGGVGAGFGAGSLLNSLIGGNQLFGSIGSGVGSLAGLALTPFLGPLGPLAGGALGGLLGGLFGNNRPANNESAAGINLATGAITSSASHGIAANDAAVQQFAQPLSQFISNLLATTGGSLAVGQIGFQAGSRDGAKFGYAGNTALQDAFGGTEMAITDDATQLPQIEAVLARSLTGLSGTLKTILDNLSDPTQIQNAVAFAKEYDSLKTAADAALSSVDKTTAAAKGPFAQALDQINTLFGSLSDQATQFGLSLDPINEALSLATNKLKGDFTQAVNDAFNSATEGGFIGQIRQLGDQYRQAIHEANALGMGSNIDDKIVDTFSAQARGILGGLTPDQLNQVSAAFADLSDTALPGLVRAALDAANATFAATNLRAQQGLYANFDALNYSATGRGYITQLQGIGQAAADATAQAGQLGAAPDLFDLISRTRSAQVSQVLSQLTPAQIDDAVSSLSGLIDGIGSLGDAAKATQKAATDQAAAQAQAAADQAAAQAQAAADQKAATEALAAAQQKANDILQAGARIREYLNGLDTQAIGTSPESRLAAAQSQFADALTGARSGDLPSLQGITGNAQTLLQAANEYYGSGPQAAALVQMVKSQLAGLPGLGGAASANDNSLALSLVNGAGSGQRSIADIVSSAFQSSAPTLSQGAITQLLQEISDKLDALIRVTAVEGDNAYTQRNQAGELLGTLVTLTRAAA